jgi:hypothetical protein
MGRILASLVVAASLLSVASSEASAWVCRAAGLGRVHGGVATPSSMANCGRYVDASTAARCRSARSSGVARVAEFGRLASIRQRDRAYG